LPTSTAFAHTASASTKTTKRLVSHHARGAQGTPRDMPRSTTSAPHPQLSRTGRPKKRKGRGGQGARAAAAAVSAAAAGRRASAAAPLATQPPPAKRKKRVTPLTRTPKSSAAGAGAGAGASARASEVRGPSPPQGKGGTRDGIECPVCSRVFDKSTPYATVTRHVDRCLRRGPAAAAAATRRSGGQAVGAGGEEGNGGQVSSSRAAPGEPGEVLVLSSSDEGEPESLSEGEVVLGEAGVHGDGGDSDSTIDMDTGNTHDVSVVKSMAARGSKSRKVTGGASLKATVPRKKYPAPVDDWNDVAYARLAAFVVAGVLHGDCMAGHG